jgi:hypothetical protein
MKLIVLAFPLVLLGCAEPVSNVRTVDDRSRLLVQGAPAGSQLYLDGKPVGDATAYAGDPGILLVEPGTHIVEVRRGDTLLFSQKIFFGGGEQRKIQVPAGGAQ